MDSMLESEKKSLRKATPDIKCIASLTNLITAYESIKSKPGNMTPGIDDSTLDGTSLAYLEKIQKLLKAGKFSFPPARRVQIPKPGKKRNKTFNYCISER